MKVCFETFGCRLNRAEALQMEADYLSRGWIRTERHDDADLIVVRGCSVTSRAQRDCERLIAHLKRKYPLKRLIVTGCLPSADKEDRFERLALPSARGAKPTAIPIAGPAPVPMTTARAYLKVQDGCSGACAFCIVPQFRGRSTSVPWGDVLEGAKRLVDAGYHELVVTGCNLVQYADGARRLPDLVEALANLDAGCRVRLGSIEPGPCATEVVQAMAAHENVCRTVHLSIQSGSELVLRAMNRPYLRKDVDALLDVIRHSLPEAGVGCDLLTGFPGETETDFLATKTLVRQNAFSNVHVFPYSERPKTPAATLPGRIPRIVRTGRARALADLARTSRCRFARSFVGRTVQIVVEKDREVSGWTGEYLRCTAVGTARRRELVRVLVTSVQEDRLRGKVV